MRYLKEAKSLDTVYIYIYIQELYRIGGQSGERQLIENEIFLKCLNKKQIRNIYLIEEKGTQEYKWKTQERGAMKKSKKIAVNFCVENKFNNSE